MSQIKKVLIANRGEIALRIIRACRDMGIRTVAVYSTVDKNAMHVQLADESVCIGPGPSRDSYLNESAILTAEAALEAAEKIGYPVMLKAAAGGGGRGMRPVHSAAEMAEAFQITKQEAKSGFGDDTLYMEKLLLHPRHIEFQVLGDKHGNVVIFGERDCSLQRKNQKVMEECPAAALTQKQRDDMIEVCKTAAKKMGYTNAGTFEFMFEDGKFYFLEMNTRLQVEHPVTEMVYGVDLVREQIRVAAGEKLGYTQSIVVPHGHAIEFRINAEDPENFTPNPGKISLYAPSGGLGVRVDSAVYTGYTIPPTYDSMIAKLIVHAQSRPACIMRAQRALDEFVIEGVKTTIPLQQKLLKNKDVKTLAFDNHWLEGWLKNNAEKK